jgi:hypothetical protein
VTPISPALLSLLASDYTAAPAPHLGALAHGTTLSWLCVVDGAWALTSSQGIGVACSAYVLAELQAAMPSTDGSGTFTLSGASGRSALWIGTSSGAATVADESGPPPP